MRETATTGNVGTGVDLYARWVLANAAGEGVGLGLTALIFASTILYAGEGSGPLAALALARLDLGRQGVAVHPGRCQPVKNRAELIKQGGPFPYARDGVVFGNVERLLPQRPRGHRTK